MSANFIPDDSTKNMPETRHGVPYDDCSKAIVNNVLQVNFVQISLFLTDLNGVVAADVDDDDDDADDYYYDDYDDDLKNQTMAIIYYNLRSICNIFVCVFKYYILSFSSIS